VKGERDVPSAGFQMERSLPEAGSIRSFIAVAVSVEVRQALAELQTTLRRRGLSLRWVQRENLHFTLKFLGTIDPGRVEPMGEALCELASKNSPFEITLGGLGAFPNLRAPRVLWVGLRAGTESLVALAQEVSAMVETFPTEADNKTFKPHLTIARIKERRPRPLGIPEKLLRASFGSCVCDRVLLMQSVLAPGGARHTLLVEAPLGSSQ